MRLPFNRTIEPPATLPLVDKAIGSLLCIALFTFPLQTVGVTLFDYPLAVPFAAIALASGLLLFRSPRLLPNWPIVALLVMWSAGTAVATANFLSLRSVGVFAILLIPTFVELPEAIRGKAVTWFLRGGILNLALVIVDVVRLKLHLPQFDTIVPFIMPGSVEEIDFRYAAFPRVKALFLEPSYCAMYLAFLVIFLDMAPAGMLSARKRQVLRILFIAAMLTCRGMAGFILLGAYGGIHLLRYLIGQYLNPRITKRAAAVAAVVVVMFIGVWLYGDSVGGIEKSVVAPQRLQHAIVSLTNPITDNSSETERLGVLSISAAYIGGASLEQVIAGEGFNSAEEWVAKTYASDGGGWALGRIANTFSTILLGTGLVGLLLYILYLRTLSPSHISGRKIRLFVPLCFFSAWILAHFATGMLIGYFLWGILYVYLFTFLPAPSVVPLERESQ